MLIDKASNLVAGLLQNPSTARKETAYIKGAELYASRGWTNIHSMSVDPNDVELLNRLANEGKIKIRVYNSVDLLDERSMPSLISKTGGAALLQPYSDDPNNTGLMTLKDVQAKSILEAALRNGTQVNIHAIGDKANYSRR